MNQLKLLLLSVILFLTNSVYADDVKLFLSSYGSVFTADADGSNLAVIEEGFAEQLVVDSRNQKLYWGLQKSGVVIRTDFDGSNEELFLGNDLGDGGEIILNEEPPSYIFIIDYDYINNRLVYLTVDYASQEPALIFKTINSDGTNDQEVYRHNMITDGFIQQDIRFVPELGRIYFFTQEGEIQLSLNGDQSLQAFSAGSILKYVDINNGGGSAVNSGLNLGGFPGQFEISKDGSEVFVKLDTVLVRYLESESFEIANTVYTYDDYNYIYKEIQEGNGSSSFAIDSINNQIYLIGNDDFNSFPRLLTVNLETLAVNEVISSTEFSNQNFQPFTLKISQPLADQDDDGVIDLDDQCPEDAGKVLEGICGCGIADLDSDLDGSFDCVDSCIDDAAKTEVGICGCGVADVDQDADGAFDCNDSCPEDINKTEPGVCGCGIADVDENGNGVIDCEESDSSEEENEVKDQIEKVLNNIQNTDSNNSASGSLFGTRKLSRLIKKLNKGANNDELDRYAKQIKRLGKRIRKALDEGKDKLAARLQDRLNEVTARLQELLANI